MKRFAIRAVIGIAAVLVVLVAYGTAIEPRFRLDEPHHEVAIPGLGDELEGTTIAVFADMQVGMWWANHAMVSRIVERVVELEPDAVLIPGDFVYGHSSDVEAQVDTTMELLAPLFARDLPVLAVMGNHDHAVGAVQQLTEALERHGVEVLHNRASRLGLTGSEATDLHVVGIAAHRPGLARPDEAFDQVPAGAPRVAMMHNPATFTTIGEERAPLAIAGHTHCGQFALPGLPGWSYLQLRSEERIVIDGFAPADFGADGNQLFVTCGIGFSLVPMRILAPPQLAVFELVADAPGSSPSQ